MFLSRLDPKKGIELLLEAFAAFTQSEKGVCLVVAGSGDTNYLQELQALAEALHIGRDVLWTGHLSGQMKGDAFAAASVFVLLSKSENFGIAAAEALSVGVPTIVSKEVGLSADIEVQRAGLVVKRNVNSISDAINRVLQSSEVARTLSDNGRALARSKYEPKAVVSQLSQLYETITIQSKIQPSVC